MISSNINRIRESIRVKCEQSGRDPEEVKLIAVSKTKPVSEILDAFENGIIHFGENKAQELRDKNETINKEVSWHFVGHLQKNKAKYVVKAAEYFHGLDSIALAVEISKRAKQEGKIQKVLLEIKTSDEESKFGLEDKSEIIDLLTYCKNDEYLDSIGLMTMAPYTDDESRIRKSFRSLRMLKNELNDLGFTLRELSMGMTSDYLLAIEEGATMVRIGTGIFGSRNY
ncbi:MAG: YggS family pyridoxal phosphate-dependent enzyme [Melioribacteraceae bacterium]|nr:YggS family pyridoxal phosphate-dependent enzyme [Melioribacteraceae bacterium]MCF8265152.1 YggS family pyridoxal phosphate-dependent enzyme [Melioribacteraceae bacterium]MCF8412257.1 YggS family pyridoxal phosphate-dependent enzyme [Melioribacteraceae bacterium]MCF8432511.1 YggS family pyridoxal phosphate-dependent enzyme [Melioribacteraceae bacterium]